MGDDRGPRDADQPRPGGTEEEAADPARREPSDLPEDDEVRPQSLQRPQHPGRRGGESNERKDDKNRLRKKNPQKTPKTSNIPYKNTALIFSSDWKIFSFFSACTIKTIRFFGQKQRLCHKYLLTTQV